MPRADSKHTTIAPTRDLAGMILFYAMKMIEIEFIVRLADLFGMPPSLGRGLAQTPIQDARHMIEVDAAAVANDPSWMRCASGTLVRAVLDVVGGRGA
jgi:hypothetical protein